MYLQSIFISVISVSYYRLLVEIMSSTPVLAIDAVDAVAIEDPVIDAPVNTNTNTTKKVKKVRVPTAVVPAVPALEPAAESGSTADAADAAAVVPEKKQKVKKNAGETDASAVEKKKRVVKKPQEKEKEKEVVAVTEVVQMVADMKTAFTEATEATEATTQKVEVAATVDDSGADAELVLDAYEPIDFEPLDLEPLDLGDSIVNFEELRLDGDDTPCVNNPIPEPISESVAVADDVAVDDAADDVAVDHAAAARPVRPVFRFEFSTECFELLNGFARENLGVPRKEYKAKWEQFATAHAEFIAQESARLADAGYDGDVLVKMFKTVKYYLTKRVKKAVDQVDQVDQVDEEALDDDDATVDAEDAPQVQQDKTRTRRHYTTLDRAVLEAMDSHITSSISSNSKPATCYASFCDQFRNSIETEIARLVRYDVDVDVVGAFTFTEKTAEEKLKKTYKNRMFLHIRNM